jgi:L-lactate dehydrogenase complex protein LldG
MACGEAALSASFAILQRVRESLAIARLPRPPMPTASGLPEIVDSLAVFRDAVNALGGRVFSPEPDAVVGLIVERARNAGAGDLMAWDDLPIPGMADAFARAGMRVLDAVLPVEASGRTERLALLEGAAVGLTGAEVGIAETGSLVLASGERRSRLAWLLPPCHIALLSRTRVLPTLESVFVAHPNLCVGSAEVALIAGPSRTADIELTLTRGVHGPRELEIILLP